MAGREPAETGTHPAVAAPMRVTAEEVVTFLLEQEQSIAMLREAVRAIQREVEGRAEGSARASAAGRVTIVARRAAGAGRGHDQEDLGLPTDRIAHQDLRASVSAGEERMMVMVTGYGRGGR